jgi:hypothetical protein
VARYDRATALTGPSSNARSPTSPAGLGWRARTRGLARITTDLVAHAAALNWARLAVLGLDHDQAGWTLPAT